MDIAMFVGVSPYEWGRIVRLWNLGPRLVDVEWDPRLPVCDQRVVIGEDSLLIGQEVGALSPGEPAVRAASAVRLPSVRRASGLVAGRCCPSLLSPTAGKLVVPGRSSSVRRSPVGLVASGRFHDPILRASF